MVSGRWKIVSVVLHLCVCVYCFLSKVVQILPDVCGTKISSYFFLGDSNLSVLKPKVQIDFLTNSNHGQDLLLKILNKVQSLHKVVQSVNQHPIDFLSLNQY
jgi:hypothetical protein